MKRIYHTWDKWECYPAGFYENQPPEGMSVRQANQKYAEFLRDTELFEFALGRIISEWKNSCEHYLTNDKMNRIAWLGQASLCIEHGIPACFRGGFNLLTPAEQRAANESALKYLNFWLAAHGEDPLTMETAASKTEANIY